VVAELVGVTVGGPDREGELVAALVGESVGPGVLVPEVDGAPVRDCDPVTDCVLVLEIVLDCVADRVPVIELVLELVAVCDAGRVLETVAVRLLD